MACGGGGQDLDNEVGGSLAADVIQFGRIAHHGDVRLHQRIYVLRAFPLPLEQSDSEGSRIDFALLPPQICMELG